MARIGSTSDPASGFTRRLRLLGGLHVEEMGKAIPLPSGQVQQLLAYLALRPGVFHARDTLAELLWPDYPPGKGRRNLSNVLYRLRRSVNAEWLTVTAEHVSLREDETLWVDVWDFESLAGQESQEALERAVALYVGDLLPEYYDDWLLARRVALRERFLACLMRLARIAERSNQLDVAIATYRRLVQEDPLRESAHRGLMRSLASSGQGAAALAEYERLVLLLEEELGVPPSTASRQLAEQIKAERAVARRALQRGAGGRPEVPFVGRVSERMHLLSRLDQASEGRGGLAVLLGEPGIGKTRLLQEAARGARWRGWQVSWGKAEARSVAAPYTPLRECLAGSLPLPRRQQVERLVRPHWLRALVPLLPPMDTRQGVGAPQPSMAEEVSPEVALPRLLRGLQEIAPHLLILDDVQWADPALWPLLEALREPLHDMSVLLVLAGRPDEWRRQSEGWSLVESWDRYGELVLFLEGLQPVELGELLRRWLAGKPSPLSLDQLFASSGGNPLFALTVLEAGQDGGEGVPPSLDALAQQRLALLSPDALSALEGAAVLGYHFEYATWEGLLVRGGLSPELPRVAGELEGAGLIKVGPERYHFVHDTLRQAAYSRLTATRREEWHGHALAVLEEAGEKDPFVLLYHAEQAGSLSAIARYGLEAGEQAVRERSMRAAVVCFSRALDALPPGDTKRQFRALLGRQHALDVLADRAAQKRDLDHLERLAESLPEPQRRLEAAEARAKYFWATGDYDESRRVAEDALALARQEGERRHEAALLVMLGRVHREFGTYDRARQLVERARDLYHALEDVEGEATVTDLLGGLAWKQGDYQRAADQHAAASRLFEQSGNVQREANSLNNLGTALWALGDLEQARAVHERALALCRELGDRRAEADNLDNLGGVAWVHGDFDSALDFYQRALAIRREIHDGWGISISLGNLGSTYRLMGEWEEALAYYAEALALNRSMGRQRGEGYALHGIGLIHLEMGEYRRAREALEGAASLREQLAERDNYVESIVGLALVSLAEGRQTEALAHSRKALDLLRTEDRAALRQWVHFGAYCVFRDAGDSALALRHLARAADAMEERASELPVEERARFLKAIPLNRQVQEALNVHARRATVRLVRAGVPLGRALSDEDYVTVFWTVYSPMDDEVTPRAKRRRHVLRRLAAEAAAQGGTPTDSDLAAALEVSRRTVLRDMEILAAEGHTLVTRGRAAPQDDAMQPEHS